MCYQNCIKEIIYDPRDGNPRKSMTIFTNGYVGFQDYPTYEITIYNMYLLSVLSTVFSKDIARYIFRYCGLKCDLVSQKNNCLYTHFKGRICQDESRCYCVSDKGKLQECPQSKINGECCDSLEIIF